MAADDRDADRREPDLCLPSPGEGDRRVRAVGREHGERALAELESRGEVSDRQRAVVAALARSLVATLAPAAIELVRAANASSLE